jgi:paraquat-inducible protein B
LRSNSNQLFSEGTSVYYRGFRAGSIEKVELDLDDDATYYQVFIESPYNELVSTNTRFWDVSGVTFESSTKGFMVHANSIESILSGGITFGLPDGVEEGDIPADGELYTLFSNRDNAYARTYSSGLNVAASFDSSLRGLELGAPVEFRGLEMGRVIELDKERSVTANDGLSHAVIRLEPGRIGLEDTELGIEELKKKIETWIGNGLNATLTTGNLLTGNKFVELNFPAQLEGRALSTKPKVTYIDDMLSVPTYSSGLESIKDKVLGMFNRAESLPLGDLVTDTSKLVKNLDSASIQLEKLLAAPETAELPSNINKTLSQFEETLAGFSPDQALYQDLEQTVFILNQSLSNLDLLLKKLKDKPNALIFNSKTKPGIAPKASKEASKDSSKVERN